MSYSAPPPDNPYGQSPYGGNYGGERLPQPNSLRLAVRLMQAGGVIAVLNGLSVLLLRGTFRDQLEDQDLSGSEIDTAVNVAVAFGLIFGLLGAALWFWMAFANGKGKKWARVVATVLFAISVLSFLASFAQEQTIVSRLLGIVVFLIGLGAIVLMYRPESSRYYEQESAPR